jgi:leucyl-tRNA synthetase
VLANEEVTADGRSERGNFPVYRRPMKQWMLRITAYADRLLDDLDLLDWTEAIKSQQRNWIGRSTGAEVTFSTDAGPLEVFTTRPDTLFGATYMVVAPEHPLVAALTTPDQQAAVDAYVTEAARRSDVDRQSEGKDKTGVFTGSLATNPVSGESIPVYVADYVLMGYGTGAIMAVPAHDQRDFEFAQAFDLRIVPVIASPEDHDLTASAYVGDGVAINSANDEVSLDGRSVAEAKATIIEWLERKGLGSGKVQYKLRDWLFSRQRYWGEPFPIVFGDDGEPQALPASELPLLLPPMEDFSPKTSEDEDSEPEPPLGRITEWTTVELDLGDGPQTYRREVNTMPNWAGSCWYELRYLDPNNSESFVDPENERYWMGPQFEGDGGGVDLYVGGVEHAVLHLLYARFWHKVLFDLGHVSSVEPFRKLFNQGMIQAYVYRDDRGFPVPAADVVTDGDRYTYEGQPVTRELGKIGKSLKNAVAPDEMCEKYGADTLRLYEMFGGPLDQSRPWDTTAVVGMYRLLQRVWRVIVNEDDGTPRVSDHQPDDDTTRVLHRTIAAVRDGMETLRFNTSIARITELTNHVTAAYPDGGVPRSVAEDLVLLLAPLAPHVAEELWARLGNPDSLAYQDYPQFQEDWLVDESLELPVSVNGKVKSRIIVAAGSDAAALEEAARADDKVAALLDGATVRKVIAVPDKMVNFVIG